MRIARADRDGPVVLVERDHADRLAAKGRAHGDQDLQDLQVLLGAPRVRGRHASRDLAPQHRGEDLRVLDLLTDPLVAGRVGDRAVRRDETAADDARHDDAAAEEPVERLAAGA